MRKSIAMARESGWLNRNPLVRSSLMAPRRLTARLLTNITLDDRKGGVGRLRGKVQDVEQILGKPLFRP
jgi:hypothetical protein